MIRPKINIKDIKSPDKSDYFQQSLALFEKMVSLREK